ncbi:MAG: endonuclease/exonuclease/phosphatase family protein [Gemmatimonadales bacterium]
MIRFPRSLAFVALLAGCADGSPLEPSDRPAVTVLNWNLYLGADVDAVIRAAATPDTSDDIPALVAEIVTLSETDFPARAEAIADAIAATRPEVVGLQEVVNIDIDLTGIGLPIVVHLDFLAILQAALAARGQDYAVAAIVTNTTAAPLPGILLVDHDALLVDPARVTVTSTIAATYANNRGVVAPGVALLRGFVGITGTIDGRSYAIFNTHLEPDQGGLDLSGLRAAQAAELVAATGGASPTILMGDFNDVAGSATHRVVEGAGFRDVWAELHPGAAGLTCCHVEDLSNPSATFDTRIDYVFARGMEHPITGVQGRVELLGEEPADRVSGPAHALWPSDHAGLVADLLVPPGFRTSAASSTPGRSRPPGRR